MKKELRAAVSCKVGKTVTTLKYAGRVLKLVRVSRSKSCFGYDIKENDKFIKRGVYESLNDIRFLFALGTI